MAPRPRSARQLAGRYEVSTRTIERDILALQESGVPVYAVTGRRGGYVIDKARTLPPLNFTAAEMVAVAVSLAGAQATPFAPQEFGRRNFPRCATHREPDAIGAGSKFRTAGRAEESCWPWTECSMNP